MERHRDRSFTGLRRTFYPHAALILGLRNGYEGGELLVDSEEEDGPDHFQLNAGDLVLLDAGRLHEVTRVTSGTRETISLILGTQER